MQCGLRVGYVSRFSDPGYLPMPANRKAYTILGGVKPKDEGSSAAPKRAISKLTIQVAHLDIELSGTLSAEERMK